MREILMQGHELTDEHISLAHDILKKQIPHTDGLQSPLLSQTNGFIPVQHEGIQIHHIPERSHWAISSCCGPHTSVYNSKEAGFQLNTSLSHQLALIYRLAVEDDSKDDHDGNDPINLFVQTPYVQQQRGGSDCGLFAIAFAVHLAFGDNLSTLQFDKALMRRHLLKCFQQKEMMPFPQMTKTTAHRPKRLRGVMIELCRWCLMPETFAATVKCKKCDDWCHLKCARPILPTRSKKWTCGNCK